MSLLKDCIDWARKQMKREETPVVVEPQVQPVTVIEEKPVRKPRKKKINLNKPSSTTMDVKND
jgi:hypothetical protein